MLKIRIPFSNRYIEIRSTLANPQSWLVGALSGGKAASGVTVNENTALKSTAVFACIRILAETVASLPLPVYRRLPGGGKERATDHYLYPLLHDQPNPEMTSFEFRETLMGHLALWGNAYAEIQRNGAGEVVALWPLRPDRMRVSRDDQGLRYEYTLPDGTTAVLRQRNIMHIRGLSGDGLIGYSPIRMAREAIGLALATEEFGARFFGQGSRPSGVLEHPGKLSDEAKKNLRESWERMHSGLSGAHRVAILEEGMKWTQIGIPPEDAQYLETRKFQVTEIARIFRIPPHMLADLERATFCLPADVEVFTENGPKSIAEVKVGERVWSLGANGWVLAPVTRSACTGEDEILSIRTENRVIRANAKHRILVRRKSRRPLIPGEKGGSCRVEWTTEYVPAGELKVGDTIVEADGFGNCGLYDTPTRKATIGFMEFCGLFLGDGYMTKGHVSIARADDAPYMDYYREVIKQEFVRYDGGNGRGDKESVPKAPVTLTEGKRYTRFASVLAAEELRKLGLNGTAHTKRVPGWVFCMADELKLAFLRGFLDADGSVDKKGRITFSSCNRELLSGIRHLCIMLGIPVTNIRCQRGTTRLPNGRKTSFESWSFVCSDPGANRRIGSHTPIYQERLNNGKPFNAKARRYPRYGGNGFDLVGCSLARIVAIEREPAEPVYDLEVAGTHSFVANGVVVHNSNIEHQSIEFVVHTIRPWLVRWEQAIKRDLFLPGEREMYFAEFLVDGLLRGDIESRYRAYSVARQWGWMSANDVRELENMNPIPGGDVYLIPLNMVPAGSAGKAQRSIEHRMLVPGEERALRSANIRRGVANSYKKVISETVRRIIKREQADIMRAAEKYFGKRNVDTLLFDAWLQDFYREHEEFVESNMLPVLYALAEAINAAAADEIGMDPGITPELEEFIRDYVAAYRSRHIGKSITQIRAALERAGSDYGDQLKVLQEEFDSWQDRPDETAQEEAVRAGNAVALMTYTLGGVQKVRWVASGKSCPYCQSLSGKVVGINTAFVKMGEELKPDGVDQPLVPSRNVKHPPAHKGCDCMIASGI